MARSESQGLQVAVILFTMLTVGLAVATYMFFSASETAAKKLKEAEASTKTAQDQLKKQSYKVKVYEYIQGKSVATDAEIDQLRGLTGGDAEADQALADFKKTMQLNEQSQTENSKGLAPLPGYLAGVIGAKNKSITAARETTETLTKEKASVELREQARAKTAEEAAQKSAADLAGERESFNAEREAFKKKQDEMVAQIAAKDKQLKETKDKADKDFGALSKKIAELNVDLSLLKDKYVKIQQGEGPTFEVADGSISWVNQRQRLAWVDVGSADGLSKQVTFSVYDHNENNVATGGKRKARLEVLSVREPHLAECRILEDDVKNPILPGDKIFTPAWSPGQHLHFAIDGSLDIDGDGRADNDEVRSIMAVNGAILDAELRPNGQLTGAMTGQTRYLIRGKAPSEREIGAEEGKQAFSKYNDLLKSADTYGTEVIDISRFLGLMSWKAQERTTTLGNKRTTSRKEFRVRTPGEAVPSAGDEAPAADAGETTEPAAAKEEKTKPAEEKAADDNPFG